MLDKNEFFGYNIFGYILSYLDDRNGGMIRNAKRAVDDKIRVNRFEAILDSRHSN